MGGSEDEKIRTKRAQSGRRFERRAAFTLVELLVVIAIISVLTAVLVPVLGAVRRKAYNLVGMTHLKQIATHLNSFALENNNRYPSSVSQFPNGMSGDPRRMTSKHLDLSHRSMAYYLNRYIDDPEIFNCPSSPEKYEYLEEMWEQADDWIHPDRSTLSAMAGHYVYYWNYRGVLEIDDEYELFQGPSRPALGKRESDLLVSDSLAEYDQAVAESWRPPEYFTSCEFIDNGQIHDETIFDVYRWAREIDEGLPEVQLKAAFVDTHVETYKATEAIGMRPFKKFGSNGPIPRPLGKISDNGFARQYIHPSVNP